MTTPTHIFTKLLIQTTLILFSIFTSEAVYAIENSGSVFANEASYANKNSKTNSKGMQISANENFISDSTKSSIFTTKNSLKVATLNIGMLDAFNSVPFVKERQKFLKSEILNTLKKHSIDVLAIQEMFTHEAIKSLKELGPQYELLSTGGDAWIRLFTSHPTGLAFLAKKSLGGSITFKDFAARESLMCGFGQVCDRGLLVYKFKIKNKEFALVNSHFTPSASRTHYRKIQIDESLKALKSMIANHPQQMTLLLGDFNFSPLYAEMRKGDSGTKEQYRKDSKLYDYFFNSAKNQKVICEDSYQASAIPPNFQYTYNRETNFLPIRKPESSYSPSRRVDHIFVCGKSKQWKSISIKKIFDRPIQPSNLNHPIHLSDHYGILSEIKY